MEPPAASIRWDLVDAVGRSPLFSPPQLEPGIDLSNVEQALLGDVRLLAADRERLLAAVREIASVYRTLDKTTA